MENEYVMKFRLGGDYDAAMSLAAEDSLPLFVKTTMGFWCDAYCSKEYPKDVDKDTNELTVNVYPVAEDYTKKHIKQIVTNFVSDKAKESGLEFYGSIAEKNDA